MKYLYTGAQYKINSILSLELAGCNCQKNYLIIYFKLVNQLSYVLDIKSTIFFFNFVNVVVIISLDFTWCNHFIMFRREKYDKAQFNLHCSMGPICGLFYRICNPLITRHLSVGYLHCVCVCFWCSNFKSCLLSLRKIKMTKFHLLVIKFKGFV